ncbi:MAG: phenylalanine--tRNA ligase subunit alpha [Planctomycetota bacterium]
MIMPDVLEHLEQLEKSTRDAVAEAASLEALREVEVRVLGRKGQLTGVLRGLKDLDEVTRRAVGARANNSKRVLSELIEARRGELERQRISLALSGTFDPTEPGLPLQRGHYHPMLYVSRELQRIFASMGFTVLDGPEVESEYFNFEALNIPHYHPARDLQDTFWLENGALLRTHTSPVQIRAMRRFGAPLRAVVPGRVFRYETQDASHEHTFHQLEGLMVDRGISVGHLKGVMQAMLGAIFGRQVTVRLRPHYFPFVEPGFELDFGCLLCLGKGCSTCKGTGWIEMLGCGMVHPQVLAAGGVDPESFTGFAFGMGVDRLAMMRYGIPDIRYAMSGDLRFFSQF